jgi:predicted nucleic acid-binding protein
MNSLIIVDTDIIIDAGRDIHDAVECLTSIERRSGLAISSVTQMELLAGCRSKIEVKRMDNFLRRFYSLKITEAATDTAIDLLRQYRLSHGLSIPDALIAATAISLDLPFISKNQRDYLFVKGLKLLKYPSISSTI